MQPSTHHDTTASGRLRNTRRRRLAGALVVAAAAGTATTGVAGAEPAIVERWHDQFSDQADDFCGDMSVRWDVDVQGKVTLTGHGPDDIPYGVVTARGTIVWTNLATGRTMTRVFSGVERDQEIVDNGDGTATITILGAGSDRLLDADGRLFLANPGQLQWQILVFFNDTPWDFSDDEFVADLGIVRESTGRNDTEGRDFCDDFRSVTG